MRRWDSQHCVVEGGPKCSLKIQDLVLEHGLGGKEDINDINISLW
jgi:hypothetical protein